MNNNIYKVKKNTLTKYYEKGPSKITTVFVLC